MTDSTANSTPVPPEHRRAIKSFVMRAGRLTKGQEGALERMWPSFGLDIAQGALDPVQVFGRQAPLVLEIGYGMGTTLVQMAEAAPEKDFIGVEVHLPGVGALLALTEEKQLRNLRTYKEDAIEVLKLLPDHCLDTVQLFFPDPWHKKKHNKRRIVQPEFAAALRRVLKTGGIFHMATDWEPYKDHMLEIMDAEQGFANVAGQGQCIPRPDSRPYTKFEKRGESKGHGVWDLMYRTL